MFTEKNVVPSELLVTSKRVKPYGSNYVKIKEAQLKISLHSPIVH